MEACSMTQRAFAMPSSCSLGKQVAAVRSLQGVRVPVKVHSRSQRILREARGKGHDDIVEPTNTRSNPRMHVRGYKKMVGNALTPPLGDAERIAELGPLLPADVEVTGDSFKHSSVDVAIAGLGWVGVGLRGTAKLRAWTHKGVAATVRDALVPDFASEMERPGLGNRTLSTPRAGKRKAK